MDTSLSELKTLSGKDGEDPKVDNRTRQDWNDYLSYLDKKGIRGNPSLDKGGLGYNLFDSYVKDNPQTSLNRSLLPSIRKDMLNYRQWALDEQRKPMLQRAVTLGDGVNNNNFMRHVIDNEKTADPNYTGSQFTSTPFPLSYMNTFMNNKLINSETKFSTVRK